MSKFSKFLQALKTVVEDNGLNTVVLTDRELWVLVCDSMEPQDRPSWTSFENWKQTSPAAEKSAENLKLVSAEEAAEFRRLLEITKVKQKMNLAKKIVSNEKGAGAWGATWIMERKFTDMAQQKQIEIQHTTKPLLEVKNAGDQKLINQILSLGATDINYEDLYGSEISNIEDIQEDSVSKEED